MNIDTFLSGNKVAKSNPSRAWIPGSWGWQTWGLLVELCPISASGTFDWLGRMLFSLAMSVLASFCSIWWVLLCSRSWKTLHSDLASCESSNQTGSWMEGWDDNKKKTTIVLTNSIQYLSVGAFRQSSLRYPIFLHHPISFIPMRCLAYIEFKSTSPTRDLRTWEYFTGFTFGLPEPIFVILVLVRVHEKPNAICINQITNFISFFHYWV